MCVCVRERERARARDRTRERERERARAREREQAVPPTTTEMIPVAILSFSVGLLPTGKYEVPAFGVMRLSFGFWFWFFLSHFGFWFWVLGFGFWVFSRKFRGVSFELWGLLRAEMPCWILSFGVCCVRRCRVGDPHSTSGPSGARSSRMDSIQRGHHLSGPQRQVGSGSGVRNLDESCCGRVQCRVAFEQQSTSPSSRRGCTQLGCAHEVATLPNSRLI